MKISAVFEAIDKITAPVKKIGAALGGLKKTVKDVGDESKDTANKTGLLGRMVERSGESFKKVKRGIGDGVAALQLFGEEVDKTKRRSTGLVASLGGLTAGLTGLLSGVSIAALFTGIIRTSSQFEGYLTSLTTVFDGDTGRAKAAMDWVKKFAQTTPYELDQVTEAYTRLTSYGIDPQNRALRTLGDAASGMNKTLLESVEAMADAQTFSFERLKEFGISTMQQGDKVRLSYVKNGKQQVIVAKKTANDVQKALLDIFDARFAGGMDRQSKTLSGIWSNLKDSWSNFQLAVGDAGAFGSFKAQLGKLLDFVNMIPAPVIKLWAHMISQALGKLFDELVKLATRINWIGLINGLAGFVSWLGKLLDKIGGLKNLVDIGIAAWIASFVFGLNALTPAIVGVAGALLGLEIAAWPITLVIAAIALLAAGAYLVWRNWDKISASFQKFTGEWAAIFTALPLPLQLIAFPLLIIANWKKITAAFDDIATFLDKWFIEKPKQWWNSMPEWFRNVLKGGALGALTMTPGAGAFAPALAGQMFAPPLQGTAGGRGQQVNGQIDLRIKSDKPVTVDRNTTSSDAFSTNILHGRPGGF